MLKRLLFTFLLFPFVCIGQNTEPDSIAMHLQSPYQSIYTLQQPETGTGWRRHLYLHG